MRRKVKLRTREVGDMFVTPLTRRAAQVQRGQYDDLGRLLSVDVLMSGPHGVASKTLHPDVVVEVAG